MSPHAPVAVARGTVMARGAFFVADAARVPRVRGNEVALGHHERPTVGKEKRSDMARGDGSR